MLKLREERISPRSKWSATVSCHKGEEGAWDGKGFWFADEAVQVYKCLELEVLFWGLQVYREGIASKRDF